MTKSFFVGLTFFAAMGLGQIMPVAEESKSYDVVCIGDASSELHATLLSLQGIVNRERAQLYLVSDRGGADVAWIHWYEGHGLVPKEIDTTAALEKYARDAKGYVVCDPGLPDTLNVAMILAGQQDALVCAPGMKEQLDKMELPCIEDLRGRWPDKLAAYRWTIDTLLVRSDLHVLANYEQGAPPSPRADMDFVVAHRGFCMGLSINEADYPAEAALWDKVQSAAPTGAMMIGWHTSRDSEATHVYFGSRHNVWVYCGGAPNMSFHQHVRNRKPYEQDHCERAECDANARYVTITLSDGDSWHSMADMQKKFWQHPRRGEVPLGWEVAPIFSRVGPAILEYYFATRTANDYLVCGPSGIGYNYLSGVTDWTRYLEATSNIMRETSLRTIWTINRVVRHLPGGAIEHRLKDGPIAYTRAQMEEFGGIKDQKGADWADPEMTARYVKGIPEALGFFQGWERIPAFVAAHVNCYDADMDTVIEVAHQLTQRGYTIVRPDKFLRLAQDAYHRGLCKLQAASRIASPSILPTMKLGI